MTGNKRGAIALTGDEAEITLDVDTISDEEIARIQTQDRNEQV